MHPSEHPQMFRYAGSKRQGTLKKSHCVREAYRARCVYTITKSSHRLCDGNGKTALLVVPPFLPAVLLSSETNMFINT